ncbi:MAG: hypothetical protein WCE63_07105, partial [Acidobacteriaceae bacterium]
MKWSKAPKPSERGLWHKNKREIYLVSVRMVLRGFRRVHFGNPRAHNDLQENLACGRSVLRCYRSAFGIKLS